MTNIRQALKVVTSTADQWSSLNSTASQSTTCLNPSVVSHSQRLQGSSREIMISAVGIQSSEKKKKKGSGNTSTA